MRVRVKTPLELSAADVSLGEFARKVYWQLPVHTLVIFLTVTMTLD